MSLDQKAIQFVENLAETLLEEEHGVVLSAKDQKRLFKETVSSLAQGKLQRELCKYSPLYCKRFQRCVRRLRQRLGASEGTNISHSGSTAQNSEDTLQIPTDQRSSEIEDEKQGEAERCISSVSAQSKERSCSSKETNNSTSDRNDQFNQVFSHDKPSVSAHLPGPVHSRKQPDVTRRKDVSCLGNSRNVKDLNRELTILYHHSDHASLIGKMNHAVGLFSAEVADIVVAKDINRASDVVSCLHSVMLYFHFKCDILHTDKNQVSFCRDSAYKQHMASMLSLYYGLNILITRSESERRSRMARHTLFKACMLLDHGHELMMDVILQLSVKPEPTDAPYLYPTLIYVLKHPPYPFTSPTYIKHVLVCRLARYVLSQDQYPDLTKQLQSSLTLLPPFNLSTWLTEHCPHLSSEMSTYTKGHQMTSYLLQVASYDLCHELQKGLYSRPDPASLHVGMKSSGEADDVTCRAGFSGVVDTKGDPAAIKEHHEIDLEEMMGNPQSKECNVSGGHPDGSTKSRKPAEHSIKKISKDNVQAETPLSADKPAQEGTTADASGISKKAKRMSRKKPSTKKALPLAGKIGEGEEEVLVVAKESKSASATGTDKSLRKQCEQDIDQGQMSSSLNKNEKERVNDHCTSVKSTCRECTESRDESLLKQREQDLQQVQIPAISPSLNMNKMGLGTDCRRSLTSKNRERLERNKPIEDCDSVIPDSCDDDTGSIDIIYSSETEHSDHLQQKMALRNARHLRSLLPSTESSKSGIGADSFRVTTRSRYKERVSDANTVQASREERQRKHESMGKETEGFRAGSPVLKDCMPVEEIRVRLVHIDRTRGSGSRAKEGETEHCTGEEDSSIIMKHASQIRRSLIKLDAFKSDSKNKAGEAPKFMVSLNSSDIGSNASIRVDSSLQKSSREFNPRKKSGSTSSPKKLDVASKQISQKKLMSEQLVDCQKSVISSDCADSGLSASTRVVSSLRRSPRKFNHQNTLQDVATKELSVDTHESLTQHSANRKPRADSKQVPSLRRSPRKGDLKDKLEFKANEHVTGQSGDPYEFIVSSYSAGDDSKASIRVDSSLQKSPREFNPRKKSGSTSSPKKLDVASKQKSQKKLMSEQSVDCQKSVISSDCADSGLSASTRVVSSLRRSPRKFNHQNMLQDVATKELSVDTHESLTQHSADRKPRADSKQVPSLRRSPRKGDLKDKLEFKANEHMTGQSGDPYEFIVSSYSAGDDSKASTKVASRRSSRRSPSPAEPQFPLGSSSCREKMTTLDTGRAPRHHSLKRNIDVLTSAQKTQGSVRKEKGQYVSAKKDSSYVGLKVQAAAMSPPSPKSSLSKFRSLRKRSFSEGCDGQSSIPSKVFTSLRGSSEELAVLQSRVSLKKIGVVSPYTQVCDSRSSQGESSAGRKTSLGGRSPGTCSKTTYKDSPRSSKINLKQGLRPRSSAKKCLVRKALEFTQEPTDQARKIHTLYDGKQ